jgi:hypothetical protein
MTDFMCTCGCPLDHDTLGCRSCGCVWTKDSLVQLGPDLWTVLPSYDELVS